MSSPLAYLESEGAKHRVVDSVSLVFLSRDQPLSFYSFLFQITLLHNIYEELLVDSKSSLCIILLSKLLFESQK